MPEAHFYAQSGSVCRMTIPEDRITGLTRQELGIEFPFEFSHEAEEQVLLKWDISYLYAELWSTREQGPVLIAPSLPEFTTDSSQPSSLRFPLSPRAISLLEALRHGDDLRLILHIQATLIGTVHRDRIPDAGRRHTLEAFGLEKEIVGPIRRSDDVTIRIAKSDWEEIILPQWTPMASSIPIVEQSALGSPHLDIHALARSLQRASTGADFKAILDMCRPPIVGL